MVKFHKTIKRCELGTALAFLIDYVKFELQAEKVEIHDQGNATVSIGQIINDQLSELKFKVDDRKKDPKQNNYTLYVNRKNQLIKVVKMIRRESGKEFEAHEILAFDIMKLQEAKTHDLSADQSCIMDKPQVEISLADKIYKSQEESKRPKTPEFGDEPDEKEKIQAEIDSSQFLSPLQAELPRNRAKEPVKDGIS